MLQVHLGASSTSAALGKVRRSNCTPILTFKKAVLAHLLFAFCLVAHADFDAKYKAYSGDLDGNGYADLFLARAPDLTMIPLDDLMVPIPTRRAEHVVLMQNANRTFTVNASPNASQLATLRTWTRSQVQLVAKDFNVDGKQDIFISSFASDPRFPAGTADQIVYAQKGVAAMAALGVSQGMREFFTQIHGWTLDRDYFVWTAIENHWYHYTGTEQTGWWYISYINDFYTYGQDHKRFLDDTDDPSDPNNPPAYCVDRPSYCVFVSAAEVWKVYGTYLANIQVIIEYQHFDQDAIRFAQAVGASFDAPTQADPTQAESILEAKLGVQVGETVADMLAYPVPRPEVPPDMMPEPPMRRMPRGLPPPAGDPLWYPRPQTKWVILSRALIWLCPLICIDKGDPDETKEMEWYHFGWEWAAEDMLRRQDPSAQVKVVIGEGEGGDIYTRIPSAAAAWQSLYLTYGIDPSTGQQAPFSNEPYERWPKQYYRFMWAMNYGWLHALMGKQALFYDIQLYGPRARRGLFYPCERRVLQSYALREERSWMQSAPFSGGRCEFFDPPP